MTRVQTLIIAGAIAACAPGAFAQTIRTVRAISGGVGPWAAAYPTIEAALAASASGDEVWVATGSYTPPTTGYTLPSGVALRGGFAGTELAPQDRDPDPLNSVTVLSGSGNRTLLTASGSAASTLVERFTLTGGRASTSDAAGGAMHLVNFTGTIRGCRFSGNASYIIGTSIGWTSAIGGDGGAVWMSGSTGEFIDCVFSGNSTAAAWGGGCDHGSTAPQQKGGSGGAVYMSGSSPRFTSCTFANNTCGLGGIGASGCTFSAGVGGNGGAGGAIAGTASSPIFTDCTFTSNLAGGGGGAGSTHGSGSIGGLGGSGGAISLSGGGSPTFTHCSFSGNRAGAGGANGLGSPDPGRPGGDGGAISAVGLLQLTLSRCTFLNNGAGTGGSGGAPGAGPASPAGGPGGSGGAIALNNTPATIVNSLIARNAPGAGGSGGGSPLGTGGAAGAAAIALIGSSNSFLLINCTLAFNQPGVSGSGSTPGAGSSCTELSVGPGSTNSHVTNTIMWNGFPTQNSPFVGDPIVTYCDVSAGATGVGNIPGDPRFANPGQNDFRITRLSPCIDAGSNLDAPGSVDLLGNTRYVDAPGTPDTGLSGGTGGLSITDIGAYEFRPDAPACPGDFNGSGAEEVQDIFDFLAAWFAGTLTADYNGSGTLEVQDIFDFLNAWFVGC